MELSGLLLSWYDEHGRDLPWRYKNGDIPDPYRVWLSEMMLQQTVVGAVKDYFLRFTHLWPSVYDLASASVDDVLREWAGLGYYARARNLHRCAVMIVRDYGGVFPSDETALRSLPGIGHYSAAAICSIAFGVRAVAVDGNIVRIMSRFFCVEESFPASRRDIYSLANRLLPADRCGDYTQALMDLGSLVCTPRSPHCSICPWHDSCLAYRHGTVECYPKRKKKPPRPMRFGVAFWIDRDDGSVLLRRRPSRGLLGGMYEIPSSDWRVLKKDSVLDDRFISSYFSSAPILEIVWDRLEGDVLHVFTHFRLRLVILRGSFSDCDDSLDSDYIWVSRSDLPHVGLPTLMKKVCVHVLGSAWRG